MSDSILAKAARLVVAHEIMADWPDCPSSYLAAAFGVHVRTVERYLLDLIALENEIGTLRAQVLAHHDPAWLTNDEVIQQYGWSDGYLSTLADRLPDARRRIGNRRLWNRMALDAYERGETFRTSRPKPRGRHRKSRRRSLEH